MSSAAAPMPLGGSFLRDLLIMALAAVLLPVGVWVSLQMVAQGPGADGSGVARADFGDLSVVSVERSTGLSAKSLSGMAHGVPGLVRDNQELITVNLQLTGRSGDHRFSPSDLRMRVGDGPAKAPVGGTLAASQLYEGSTLEGAVGFVVPRGAGRLVLEVDSGRGIQSVRLRSLPAPAAPAPADTPHSEHG